MNGAPNLLLDGMYEPPAGVEFWGGGEMGGSRGRWCSGSSLAVWVTRGASGFFGCAQNDSIESGVNRDAGVVDED